MNNIQIARIAALELIYQEALYEDDTETLQALVRIAKKIADMSNDELIRQIKG